MTNKFRKKTLLNLLLYPIPFLELVFYILVPITIASIPVAFLVSSSSVCIVNNLLHVECPGCGMTRAIFSLFHGAIVNSYHYNHLIVIVFPLLCYVWTKNTVNAWKKLRKVIEML